MRLNWYCHKQTLASSINLSDFKKVHEVMRWYKYLAFAFITPGFIQCNVYNNAIQSLFISCLLYFDRILYTLWILNKIKKEAMRVLFHIYFPSLCNFRNFPDITCSIEQIEIPLRCLNIPRIHKTWDVSLQDNFFSDVCLFIALTRGERNGNAIDGTKQISVLIIQQQCRTTCVTKQKMSRKSESNYTKWK